MELILVRHALPRREVVSDGVADPHLAELGVRQALAVAAYLAEENIDAIWTSPMNRARETAQALADRTGVAPLVDDGLAEWDIMSSEYVPIEELKATNDPRWKAMQTGEWAGGLDPIEFQATVVVSVEGIIGQHPGDRVAVFCHAGVLGTYLAHILGIPRPGGFFHPDYTSIHRVIASSKGHRTVQSLNELTHLHVAGVPRRPEG